MSQRVVFQILAVDVIHDNVVDVILIPIIKNSYNMGVAEMQQDMCLALEACQQFAVVREFNVHDFYSVDTIVFRVTRNIDSCKAALSQLINEFVPPLDDTTYHVATHAIDSS